MTEPPGARLRVGLAYMPADDLTDPAASAFAHLDATTVLSRQISELGIYPAVDPLGSTSISSTPASFYVGVGQTGQHWAGAVFRRTRGGIFS